MDVPGVINEGTDSEQTPTRVENILGDQSDKNVRYVRHRRIGKGAHGEAHLVIDRHEKVAPGQKRTLYVAKVMDIPRMSKRDVRYAYSEVRCMSLLSHANVVKYVADYFCDGKLLIVMEYADGGDLERQVRTRAFRSMSYFLEHEVFFMFLQLVLALDHVHTRKMLHRDLKTANVFVGVNGVVKLGDFGYANAYEKSVSDGVAGTFCGTPVYIAPEIWLRHRYSKKADIWSLGVVLYELLALKRPFFSLQVSELMDRILNFRHSPPPPHFSDDIIDLCGALLQKDPAQRPTTAEMGRSPHIRAGLEQLASMVHRNPHLSESVKSCIRGHTERLIADDVPPKRPAITSGPAMRACGTVKLRWEPCWLELTESQFVTLKSQEDAESREAMECSTITNACPVSNQETGETAGAAEIFAVFFSCAPHMLWFRCASADVAGQWLEALLTAIEKAGAVTKVS